MLYFVVTTQLMSIIYTQSVTGISIPELSLFDDAMVSVMDEYDLTAGILAVSKDGNVVYQRGFGNDIQTEIPIPENMPMRLASVEKPLTAAVIRDLASDGFFSLNDFVFDLGQLGGGILPSGTYFPYDGRIRDNRLANITVNHLLQHRGGWDIFLLDEQNDIEGETGSFFDPQMEAIRIADKTNVTSPPGREVTVSYMMSQPLQYMPGSPPCNKDSLDNCLTIPAGCYCGFQYSNFGYMLLGLIIEEVTGETVATQLRKRILTPEMWIPETEIFTGQTLYSDTDPREPYYIDSGIWLNVFDPNGDLVSAPYGGFDLSSWQGHGNLVSSATPILKFLDNYVVIGTNIGGTVGSWSGSGFNAHNGAMPGTNTIALRHGDNINIVVLFNQRNDDALNKLVDMLLDLINNWGYPQTWPTFSVDGFWLDFNATVSGFGGYDDPFHTMETVLASTADGTKLRIRPGSSNWAGKITKKMLIDAPFGTVTIGK